MTENVMAFPEVSQDVYRTWGQILYVEYETLIEEIDWVLVSLEMVVLSGINRCLFVITEECYVDGVKLVDRKQTEIGRISERFAKIRNVVERYESWCAYWKEKERKETEWTT